MRRIFQFSFACLMLLAFYKPGFVLDPNKSVTQYVHDVWSVGDGLPQGSVYAGNNVPGLAPISRMYKRVGHLEMQIITGILDEFSPVIKIKGIAEITVFEREGAGS